jgi:probable addiction module antidote protein
MSKYRSFDEVQEKYYRDHPEEIDEFLSIAFEDYASDKDTGALLVQLRMIARVKGVSTIAEAASMSRKGLQKALSVDSKPRFESIATIMDAMGYNLMPQHKLDSDHHVN